jgi:hypothetical protein
MAALTRRIVQLHGDEMIVIAIPSTHGISDLRLLWLHRLFRHKLNAVETKLMLQRA